MRLRDGGAGVSQHQSTRPSLPLPSARQRLAGCRVSAQGSSQDDAPPPLRCSAPSDSPDLEDSAQLTLFKDRKYAYHVLVTNLTLSPWRVYRFYSVRATIEKNIREFVYDYPLGNIPTDTWTANVAFFQLVLFAADIVHWFKRLCLPPHI